MQYNCKNYKYINHRESNREKENRRIRTCILELYANTNKRLGANKIKICLKRDYRINISTGRVYRLMKEMNLPKISTAKPFKHKSKVDSDLQKELLDIFEYKYPFSELNEIEVKTLIIELMGKHSNIILINNKNERKDY